MHLVKSAVPPRGLLVVLALVLAGTAGCSSAATTRSTSAEAGASSSPSVTTTAESTSAGLPVGAGPTTYVVQTEPPAGSCHYRRAANGDWLPDPRCTPGATNPKVTDATLGTTICRSGGGYTKSIRPGVSITGPEKRSDATSYGYTGPLATAEYDHLVSLELGGDPNDPRNLWVEPPSPGKSSGGTTNAKDPVENQLAKLVCEHKVSLAAAQQAIATDWTTALSTVGFGPH